MAKAALVWVALLFLGCRLLPAEALDSRLRPGGVLRLAGERDVLEHALPRLIESECAGVRRRWAVRLEFIPPRHHMREQRHAMCPGRATDHACRGCSCA